MEDKKLQEALKKEEDLKDYFRQLKSVAVAFSGGVDSTYLLKVAHDTLGDQVIAVTAKSGERTYGSDPFLRKRRHPSLCM